jgi:hypothetical protein
MAESERDNTDDWLPPPATRPATVGELEQRIDVALAVARASETAALEIGAAALDAAEQARRAAELAERASDAAHGNGNGGDGGAPAVTPPRRVTVVAANGGAQLESFTERADRVMARLRALG